MVATLTGNTATGARTLDSGHTAPVGRDFMHWGKYFIIFLLPNEMNEILLGIPQNLVASFHRVSTDFTQKIGSTLN